VFEALQVAIPAIPQETRFRLQGTPQSIAVSIDDGIDGGERIVLDNIETSNLRASLPDLKLASLDVDSSVQVKRAHAAFPVAAHTHLTDASIDTVLAEPLGAELSIAPQALRFGLNRPLDTGKLLDEVGLSLDGIQPQATLTDLQANLTFAGKKLAGLDVTGALAAGPLAAGASFAVSQQAPAIFHVAAPELPKVTVSASVPDVAVTLDGGKLRASAAANVTLSLTLANSPPSPLFTQLGDAATGLSVHIQKATQVFGAESFSAFPIDWDLEVTGGSPTVSLASDHIAVNANTVLHRIDIGQETIDGSVDLHAGARLAEDHLLLDLNAPADIGALGRHWQLDTPVLLALRKELLPGTGGELFDSAFYGRVGGQAAPGAQSGTDAFVCQPGGLGDCSADRSSTPAPGVISRFGDIGAQSQLAGGSACSRKPGGPGDCSAEPNQVTAAPDQPTPGANPFRLAIGYGDALQVHTAFQQPFTSGTVGGLAQAAIRWQPGAASIDSFGTLTFRGLEAGAIALPNPYLEDRLDGDVRFSANGFLADRLLAPQLLADASRVSQLDLIDLSVQVRSAASGARLPGILQAATGIELEPANRLVRLLTSRLNLKLPPRALQYQHMALDFRVQQGQVQTEPVLLTLSGVQAFGVAGLTLDSNVRIMWGGHGREPAPLLRDLIYTVQRVTER
jgi:hypothetical protein